MSKSTADQMDNVLSVSSSSEGESNREIPTFANPSSDYVEDGSQQENSLPGCLRNVISDMTQNSEAAQRVASQQSLTSVNTTDSVSLNRALLICTQPQGEQERFVLPSHFIQTLGDQEENLIVPFGVSFQERLRLSEDPEKVLLSLGGGNVNFPLVPVEQGQMQIIPTSGEKDGVFLREMREIFFPAGQRTPILGGIEPTPCVGRPDAVEVEGKKILRAPPCFGEGGGPSDDVFFVPKTLHGSRGLGIFVEERGGRHSESLCGRIINRQNGGRDSEPGAPL